MKKPLKKLASIAISLTLAWQIALTPLGYQNSALACGPFFDQTIFSLSRHPDQPFKLYVKGQLGIVRPTYADAFQIIAYRYLSGKPLTAHEQASYLDYWHHRTEGAQGDDSSGFDTWLKDRESAAAATGTTSTQDHARLYFEVNRTLTEGGWSSYLNCHSDAFKTASATLAKLVAKYGASSPICKEWLKGQDAVFCHCQSPGYDYTAKKPQPEPAFPDKLPETAPLELRQDRQYQMASAYFYAQRLDDALSLFTAIAQDKLSPWHTIGQYMVARTLIRKGTLTKKDGYDSDSLAKAMALLKQLSSNPDFTSFKSSIANLIDFAQLRIDSGQSCQTLGKLLASPYAGEDLSRKIDDYIFIEQQATDRDAGEDDSASEHKEKAIDPKLAAALRSDDLTDWLWCFGTEGKSALTAAAEGFKMHHNLVWAIAYASKLTGGEPTCAEVLNCLAKVAKSDPGFVCASYYRARLLMGGKHFQDADTTIDQALASAEITPSAANALARLKLDRAKTLEEFFSLSFRPPAAVMEGSEAQSYFGADTDDEKKNNFGKIPAVLLPESAEVINSSFPLADFVAAVTSKNVEPRYVKQFAQAAFTRAVILGDWTTALKMTPVLKRSYPPIAKQIADFESAHSESDRAFAAVCIMLKCPGIRPTVTGGTGRGTAFDRIDDYQDNWWDKDTLTGSGDRGGDESDQAAKTAMAAPFLSATDKTLAKAQLAKLAALGSAVNYMGKIAIAYARDHSADPRIPEALALTVKASHFGSSDQSKTTAVSTQAFQILHKNYPGSPWAKKTPFHY